MSRALGLAAEGLGRVAPNPSVGCVLVKNGAIIGEGRTADGGRPHAEAEALSMAGDHAKGATAYITLEPCVHEDREGCAAKLVAAGISRAVIGCPDRNPAIQGKGVAALTAAGIGVETGCLEEACADLNRGFFLSKTESRPLVTLKTATSLDSKIATSAGESRWITGPDSRAYVHRLRARHDAILTGIGTLLADDPELTARLEGVDHKSVRVILDTHLRFPLSARMLDTKQHGDILVFTKESADPQKLDELVARGVTVIHAPLSAGGQIDLSFVLASLAARGITRLMVEAGQGILSAFIASDLWDDLYIMRAPILLGTEGRDAIGALGLSSLAAAPRLILKGREVCGEDLVEQYRRRA